VAPPPVYVLDPSGGGTLKAFQPGPAGTLNQVDLVDITSVIQSVADIRSTLGLDQDNSWPRRVRCGPWKSNMSSCGTAAAIEGGAWSAVSRSPRASKWKS
jgi:hypothetical protein